MPNNRFNVGDRVVISSGRDGLTGRTATIHAIRCDGQEIGLYFDNSIPRGHNLDGDIPDGYGWWVCPTDIRRTDIPAPTNRPRVTTIQERFPVGMRVRYIGSYAPIRNYEGTVICYRNNRNIGIYFDNSCSDFHNLDGQCEIRHGYYFNETDIESLGVMVKIKTRVCSCCKQRKATMNMTKGTNGKYTCVECTRVRGYSTRNDVRIHKEKTHKKTYGFEFEVIPHSREDVAAIMSYGWGLIPTDNGSLASGGIEFKTPTYHSLNGLKPLLRTMSKHANFTHSSCGQHINIGDVENINERSMRILRASAKDLFNPLYYHMERNESVVKRLCGRFFTDYASHQAYTAHSSWINLSHDNRIEFRLSKCKNANQYFQLVCMWTEMLDCVIAHFIKKAVEVPVLNLPTCCENHRRSALERLSASVRAGYDEAIATNKAFADKTAQNLIKIFDKYAQGKATCQRPERNSYTSRNVKRTTAA